MLATLADFFTAQRSISGVNAVMAWCAALAHVYAALSTGGWLRRMFIAIASLALFYSFAYWWLFFNPERVVEWSDFLRPVGLLTWVGAWTLEPFVLVHYMKRKSSELQQRAQSAVDEANEVHRGRG